MVFSSLEFLYLFLPLCALCYGLAKTISARNTVLIVFSLIFYAWGEPIYLFLMLATIMVDYGFGLLLGKYRGTVIGKLVMVLAMVVNLGSIGVFKYAGFFVNTLNGLAGTQIPSPEIALPIGISFYTFQAISYLVDVYRGDVPAQRYPHKLLLYISMFPQLFAGPIVRYDHIMNEIDKRSATPVEISMGIDRFIVGLAKKVIFANAMGQLASMYLDKQNLSDVPVLAAWVALTAYALQIYFDFSAYSDMAIGMGRMMGFHFHENFNYPYMSASITEFWRRWHMSLGSFFRDYVYIPLGGNRCSKARHIFNMFVVWFLTGLWHGASWNFVLWGLYFFVFLVLEKYCFGKFLERHKIFAHVYFLIVVVFGWSLFYYTDMGRLGQLILCLFGLNNNGFSNVLVEGTLRGNVFILLIAFVAATPILQVFKKLYIRVCNIGRKEQEDGTVVYTTHVPATVSYIIKGIILAGLLLVCTAMLSGQSYNPFIYFRF